MAKGNMAKEAVANKIIAALGADYVATIDKKIYAWAVENGERIQVAISMTCPKTPVSADNAAPANAPAANHDWSGTTASAASAPVEISKEDDEKVAELMKKLGIAD